MAASTTVQHILAGKCLAWVKTLCINRHVSKDVLIFSRLFVQIGERVHIKKTFQKSYQMYSVYRKVHAMQHFFLVKYLYDRNVVHQRQG